MSVPTGVVNLNRKVLVFVGWYCWWKAFERHFNGSPRRSIFGLSIFTLEAPMRAYVDYGMKKACTGVVIVYGSRYLRADAREMATWINDNFPLFPKIELLYIPKSYDEIEAAT